MRCGNQIKRCVVETNLSGLPGDRLTGRRRSLVPAQPPDDITLFLIIISNFIDQEFPKIANKIEVNLLENEDNFTDDEWNNLYKLSEETFVEESDSLKEGAAGAGLTDND